MEQLEANIRNLICAEHKSVYDLASKVLVGLKSEEKTQESRIAYSMFNAIIRFADSRLDVDRALNQLIGTCKSEQARLRQGSSLDLGWINSNRFEEAVQESKKLQHEINTLAYLIGLPSERRVELFQKIQDLTEYNK